MAVRQQRTIQKISVRIWRPIIEKLDEKIDSACLRRDAYLAKVLETESICLDREVSIQNSQASYDYVFERLDQLDRKLVSLSLPEELTRCINEVCLRKRIVRDAFFNRLFFLLAASPKVIDKFFFGAESDNWRDEVWAEFNQDPAFFQSGFYPLPPMTDPFWAIRSGLAIYADDAGTEDYVEPANGKSIRVTRHIGGAFEPVDSIYTTIFDEKIRENDLLGLSCFMADWRIPGHESQRQYRAKLDDLFAEL